MSASGDERQGHATRRQAIAGVLAPRGVRAGTDAGRTWAAKVHGRRLIFCTRKGSIERVLHGFALSLLVDERHYATLSNHINSHHLGQRLIYYRTGHVEHQPAKPVGTDSLVLKLNIKKCHQSEWLSTEVRCRFDYACVDSVQAFRRTDRALTKEGQIKHSKIRHEKDDRRSIGDRRHWVLEFDNREKLALYRKQAQELAGEISDLDGRIRALSEKENARVKRAIHCQTLVNLQW